MSSLECEDVWSDWKYPGRVSDTTWRRKTITAEEFLEAGPDTLGRIDIVNGRVIHLMAQGPIHAIVIHNLTAALRAARRPDRPCMQVLNDVAVRLLDSDAGKLNASYPDAFLYGCEPYDVNTVREQIYLIAEVTSPETFENDLEGAGGSPGKLIRYARNGIPVYLVVRFDKNWQTIERIEEYRLDWSGIHYQMEKIHTETLTLEDPLALSISFADLQAT